MRYKNWLTWLDKDSLSVLKSNGEAEPPDGRLIGILFIPLMLFFSFFTMSAKHMLYTDFTVLMREQKTLDTMTEREKALRKDGYRAGWNDRADHDRELIEDAARQSSDYEEFISNIRELFKKTEASILL
jgi:hypothetical protein